jgi:hypothetical protein
VSFSRWPPSAAWTLEGAHDGFEVCYFATREDGTLLRGHTAAVDEGVAWAVRYEIEVDARRRSRRAVVWSASDVDERTTLLEADGEGRTGPATTRRRPRLRQRHRAANPSRHPSVADAVHQIATGTER